MLLAVRPSRIPVEADIAQLDGQIARKMSPFRKQQELFKLVERCAGGEHMEGGDQDLAGDGHSRWVSHFDQIFGRLFWRSDNDLKGRSSRVGSCPILTGHTCPGSTSRRNYRVRQL